MNTYRFEEIKAGMTEQFTVELTEESQKCFAELSGDHNPLHLDRDFAVQRGFNGPVAYGMLAASYYSTLAGVYLPGENCLLNECRITWQKPVYLGDTLVVEGTVSDIREATRRIKINGTMTNQHGEIVNQAVITVSFTQENGSKG